MFHYVLTRNNIVDESHNILNVCGIDVLQDGQMIESIKDISIDTQKMEKFVSLLNTMGASVIHFRELIDDFLCI